MKKLLTAMLLAMLISANTAFALDADFSKNFKDIKDKEDFKEGILLLKQHGIVKGQGETGEFKPESELNRAELLKILVESMYADGEKFDDLPNPYSTEIVKVKSELEGYKTKCFKDVKGNEWFAKYICYAKAKNWIKGYDDETFRPAQIVNFVEALKMALEIHGIEYDEDKTEWFKGIVERAANSNLIPEDVTGFSQKLRRGQMADLIARIIKHKQGKLDDYLGARKEWRVDYQTLKAKRNLLKERKEKELEIEVENDDN